MEFDSGTAGSGQAVSIWRLGRRYFLIGEGGAFGVAASAEEALEDWRRGSDRTRQAHSCGLLATPRWEVVKL